MNKQLLMYIHSVFLLKTIESDNRECKYRRHFQGRERNRDSNSRFSFVIGNPIVLLPENLVTSKKEKKKIISSLFELIFLLSSFIQRFRCNSLRFHFSRRISSIFHRGNGLKLEGLNESKANVNGKAEGSSSTVETLFLYPFRDTIRHNIAH